MTGILAACMGKPGVTAFVLITDRTVSKSSHGTTTAGYSIVNDGLAKNADGTVLEAWLNGTGGSVSNYEVRATVTYGALSSGTSGSWLACSSTRSWTLSNSAADNSTVTAVMLVEIRLASSGVVQDSATITLNAESREPLGGGGRGRQ